MLFSSSAFAASNKQHWETASDIGVYSLVGLSLILRAVNDDWTGSKQAAYSLATASGVGLLAKALVDAERPDGSDMNSSPSNLTANAFAAATSMHRRYGWQTGLPAYTVATLVGVGRVEGDKHYWRDVLAGAAIGIAAGYFWTDPIDSNVQLMPWVSGDEVGLSLSASW